jgi:hypothetical protein|nr:MAG TPA: hypothetical protein [Caudoviricetes sp.]
MTIKPPFLCNFSGSVFKSSDVASYILIVIFRYIVAYRSVFRAGYKILNSVIDKRDNLVDYDKGKHDERDTQSNKMRRTCRQSDNKKCDDKKTQDKFAYVIHNSQLHVQQRKNEHNDNEWRKCEHQSQNNKKF